MPGLRVVLDTNVLVSGLAYPGSLPGRIVTAWRQGGLDVVLSRYILDEMVRVLPRLSRVTLSAAEIRDLADSFMFLADVVEPAGEQDKDLRDPSDQLVLATLLASEANYLIIGDKDLLDGVKQDGRSNDIHLGRLDGDECRCLGGHGVGS